MRDSARFAAAIPHTSRTRREDEADGADYHFISRVQCEQAWLLESTIFDQFAQKNYLWKISYVIWQLCVQDILARKFVEHGEYEKAYYGTSLEAIRAVVNSEKICVLNLHPQVPVLYQYQG